MLQRPAVVITQKQPFRDWLLKVFPDDTVPDMEGQLYLIPSYNTGTQCEAWLKRTCAELFTEQLFLWYTDEGTYPDKMNYKVFLEWFDIIIVPTAWDTQQGFIEKM